MGALKRSIALVLLLSVVIVIVASCSFEDRLMRFLQKNIETIKDSVVMIETYSADRKLLATGSGFAAYNSDWIITNMHVIEAARYIDVTTDDGEKFFVKEIVLYNKRDDLAILKIDGELEPLAIGETRNLKVKDKVTAIGSPKGERNTVSEGIISNIDVKNEIRITAPISHGSSGGVLLNDYYEVIGITSAGYDDAQNLNFAIDISVLERMCKNYLNNKYDELNAENYINFIPQAGNPQGKNNLEICEKIASSSSYNYTVDSLETFYKATSKYEIFDTTIGWIYAIESYGGKEEGNLYSHYFELDAAQKREAADNYMYLLEYETDITEDVLGNTTQAEIKNWEIEEYILKLNLLSIYELAILMVEIDESMIVTNEIIDYLNETTMSYEAKIVINRLLDNTDNDYNKDIIDFYNENDDISYDQEVALLEYLGMTVDADGKVYWD